MRNKTTPANKLRKSRILPISVPQYPGKKTWFLPYAAKFFRAHRCQTLIEPFAGSAIIGLSLLHAGMVERLVLVEKDERMVCLLRGLLEEPELADRYAKFNPTRENVKELLRSEQSAFRYLVQSRCSNRGKFSGGLYRQIDSYWCRDMIIENIRHVYDLRERITVIEGEALDVMRQYAGDPNVGCFADPPYTADRQSKGHTVYPHHRLKHQKLFSVLAGWRGPWLLTEDNSRMVRRLAACYRFDFKRFLMWTAGCKQKNELVIWRRRRIF